MAPRFRRERGRGPGRPCPARAEERWCRGPPKPPRRRRSDLRPAPRSGQSRRHSGEGQAGPPAPRRSPSPPADRRRSGRLQRRAAALHPANATEARRSPRHHARTETGVASAPPRRAGQLARARAVAPTAHVTTGGAAFKDKASADSVFRAQRARIAAYAVSPGAVEGLFNVRVGSFTGAPTPTLCRAACATESSAVHSKD